jgi:hypothetical protein
MWSDILSHVKEPEIQLAYSALKMAENMVKRVKRYDSSLDLEADFSELFNR